MVTIAADATWRQDAACLGVGPDLFFPTRGDNTMATEAKKVCRSCRDDVRRECLQEALVAEHGEKEAHGIFGGLSVRERQAYRKRHGITVTVLPPVRLRDYSETRYTGAVVIDLDGRRRSAPRKTA